MARTEEERFAKSMRGEIVKNRVSRNQINGYNEYVSNFETIHFTKDQAYSILRNVARQQRALGRTIINDTRKNRGYEGGYYGHRLTILNKNGDEMFHISAAKQINGKYTIHVWRREIDSHGKKLIYAKRGYHGIINRPTRFLVGEKGPERVNVTPIKKHKPLHNKGLHIGKINIGNVKIRKFI